MNVELGIEILSLPRSHPKSVTPPGSFGYLVNTGIFYTGVYFADIYVYK